jgi:hypothetical protein
MSFLDDALSRSSNVASASRSSVSEAEKQLMNDQKESKSSIHPVADVETDKENTPNLKVEMPVDRSISMEDA